MNANTNDLIGETWGRFKFLEFIGAGGMGRVYRAKDRRLGRDVAIKVLNKNFADHPESVSRFEQEARTAGSMNHANILAVYDLGCHNGQHFLVTELLHGATLKKTIESGPVPFDLAIEWSIQVARGLDAVHALGIVHRDIKPGNLIVAESGLLKILDFGLAKVNRPDALDHVDTSTRPLHTVAGQVVGTVGYMSPEQVRGEVADHLSDIFSFGCVLYELISGHRAFSKQTAVETLTSILHDEPLSRSEIRQFPALGPILERCLAKASADRYDSVKLILRALQDLKQQAKRDAPAHDSHHDQRPSIAVLPFANLSAESEQEYFCDGMAEEIINALAHIDGL